LHDMSQSKLNELRDTPEPITLAAQHNVDMTKTLMGVTHETEKLSQQQSQQRGQVEDLKRRMNLVKRQLEIGGGSVMLNDVLRNQRRHLATPVLPFLSSGAAANAQDIASMELTRFQLQQERY